MPALKNLVWERWQRTVRGTLLYFTVLRGEHLSSALKHALESRRSCVHLPFVRKPQLHMWLELGFSEAALL